ncbi:MAG: hypothetical protein KF812_09370 [Fimbriimonadaceae bacterium]|nr:hypothetical protein [Fimbriimonadaceae bacterium]
MLDVDLIEHALASQGLEVSLRTTLKAFPGGMHWHLRLPGHKGTLELTLHEGRLWFKVAQNRRADWMLEAIERFRVGINSVR